MAPHLLAAAQNHGGKLTVTRGVLATGFTFVEIEQCLTELSKTGSVEIENDSKGI